MSATVQDVQQLHDLPIGTVIADRTKTPPIAAIKISGDLWVITGQKCVLRSKSMTAWIGDDIWAEDTDERRTGHGRPPH